MLGGGGGGGGGGGAVGVTTFEGPDAGPVPTVLVAVTVNVTDAPMARPPTVIDVPAPDAD
jgi:hypothetical protein